MKVAVLGLWHLGCVTAACVARAGHEVVGWDSDQSTVSRLVDARAPVAEPGLNELLGEMLAARRLTFTSSLREAVGDADVVWITIDTPVDEEDRADVEAVMGPARAALATMKGGALVIVSSQLPVGSVARLEREFSAHTTHARADFACIPENLRLGNAIQVFTRPDRMVAGVRTEAARSTITTLLAPITDRIVWMSVESAEMTKHAINAFLGTSVAFINELASICEAAGADAKEVERGMKSDQRIGPGAYLSPGAAFAGGTLARDLVLLEEKGADLSLQTPLLCGVLESNRRHGTWTHRTLMNVLAPLSGRRVAVWGLTYKAGTNTLRRSLSVELCRMLAGEGVLVSAYDPGIPELPASLVDVLSLAADPLSAASGADAVVVATGWPILQQVSADELVERLAQPIVVDAGRFLGATLGQDPRIRYMSVGTARL
jgi:UDPglucose 6-dehydrogenase